MGTYSSDLIVQRNIEVPMRDGTILRADLYRPAAEGPFPALLQRTPYSKDFDPGLWVVLDPIKAASAGFAVVVQDVRGRGRSDGDFYPFTAEAQDGEDSVAWVREQSWCNGAVGMYGSSYMAAAAWQAAKRSPDGLMALAPFQASSDYYEGRSYRGGAFELGALLGVSLNALGGGIAHRMIKRGELRPSAAREAREAVNDLAPWARTAPVEKLRETVLGDIAPFFFDWAAANDPASEIWTSLSVESCYPDVEMPVLHLSSWFDQAHVGTLRNFEGMTTRAPESVRDQQFLLMGPWAHRVPRGSTLGQLKIGDLYFGTGAMFDMDNLQIRFFRSVLAGEPAAWPYPERVRLFMMGENVWRDYPQWPPAEAQVRRLHLAGNGTATRQDGSLSWEVPAVEVSDSWRHDPENPVPTLGGAHMTPEAVCPAGPVEQTEVQRRDDVVVFTGPELTEDLDVIGWVEAELWVDGSAVEADYSITLSDVHPDGRSYNVCDGYLHVPAGTATPDAPLRIGLGATAQRFRTGHRIRVHIAGSSSPRHPIVGGVDGAVRTQTVRSGGVAASAVLLPVVAADSTAP
ncbi:CocE/NonD family hydrolase [Rhodococcus sp. NPDC047139]|uniref:CocE/NonD family hydrolase n=1 Tax=Rhodococcus sp. NPDC047139 TaxID=3155141 RepID=UPI0033DCFE20